MSTRPQRTPSRPLSALTFQGTALLVAMGLCALLVMACDSVNEPEPTGAASARETTAPQPSGEARGHGGAEEGPPSGEVGSGDSGGARSGSTTSLEGATALLGDIDKGMGGAPSTEDADDGSHALPPRPPCLSTRQAMLSHMREEMGPRLGVPEQREELVGHLLRLPEQVPFGLRAEWEELVGALPESGALAPLCARCHATLRPAFLDSVGESSTRDTGTPCEEGPP